MAKPEIIHQLVKKHGHFPNNGKLPVVIYKKALHLSDPKAIEKLLLKNGWKNSWINGVYTYHHYHSNTHEVLVVACGRCKVQLGGDKGLFLEIEHGDVLFLPAGVSHKNMECSVDFICIGAYPFAIEYDMNYGAAEEVEPAEKRIEKTPLPESDPIYGKENYLLEYWV